MNYINKILQSKKTVFTYKDIAILLGIKNRETIKSLLHRYTKSGLFQQQYRGIYTLPNFDIYELASKIKKISYISFETVLKSEGIIFQDYKNTIFLASNNTGKKNVMGINFEFKKIKNEILYNSIGIIQKGQYAIASPERAICDRLYLSQNYYFDNLENINLKKLEEISKIYNKRVILTVNKIINDIKHKSA